MKKFIDEIENLKDSIPLSAEAEVHRKLIRVHEEKIQEAHKKISERRVGPENNRTQADQGEHAGRIECIVQEFSFSGYDKIGTHEEDHHQ